MSNLRTVVIVVGLAYAGCKHNENPPPTIGLASSDPHGTRGYKRPTDLADAAPTPTLNTAPMVQVDPPDAQPGICQDLDLSRLRVSRGEVFVLRTSYGFRQTYYLDLERDLNADGQLDLVLHSIEGCSRSGGCMIYVFANCGDGSVGQVASLNYGKAIELARSFSKGWRNLWLMEGDIDPDNPKCYLEARTLYRWNGETYAATKQVKEKRTCGVGPD